MSNLYFFVFTRAISRKVIWAKWKWRNYNTIVNYNPCSISVKLTLCAVLLCVLYNRCIVGFADFVNYIKGKRAKDNSQKCDESQQIPQNVPFISF